MKRRRWQQSHASAARDRCGDAMDRIRAIIGSDALHGSGAPDARQAAWLTPGRPEMECYDPPTERSLPEIQKDKRADYQRTWQTRLQKRCGRPSKTSLP